MPLDISRFVKTRPHLYHLTARSNLKLIAASGHLRTAADLLAEAGERPLLRQRRPESRVVVCGASAKAPEACEGRCQAPNERQAERQDADPTFRATRRK